MRNQPPPAKWAPRVKEKAIRRLYASGLSGIADDGLLDDVGWELFARCEAVCTVADAYGGLVPCPQCGGVVERASKGHQRRSGLDRGPAARCSHCQQAVDWLDRREALRSRPRCFGCGDHLRLVHFQATLACDRCGVTWEWSRYRRSIKDRRLLPCPHCGNRLRMPDRVPAFANAVPSAVEEQIPCPDCGRMGLHATSRFQCPHCGRTTTWRSHRRRLKRRTEPLCCSSCGRSFTWERWRKQSEVQGMVTGNDSPARTFLVDWPRARSGAGKARTIDDLLHAHHGRGSMGPIFLEGTEQTVAALLDHLALKE